jgi:hypothetical protein
MTGKYCSECATRLERTATRGGIPHLVCPNCGGNDA